MGNWLCSCYQNQNRSRHNHSETYSSGYNSGTSIIHCEACGKRYTLESDRYHNCPDVDPDVPRRKQYWSVPKKPHLIFS